MDINSKIANEIKIKELEEKIKFKDMQIEELKKKFITENLKTPEETKINKFIKYYQNKFNLDHITIETIITKATDSAARGLTDNSYISDYAKLTINPAFDDLELTVIHELLHVLFKEEYEFTNRLPGEIFEIYNNAHERAIERLTKIIYNYEKEKTI